jgi:hypothetical protein
LTGTLNHGALVGVRRLRPRPRGTPKRPSGSRCSTSTTSEPQPDLRPPGRRPGPDRGRGPAPRVLPAETQWGATDPTSSWSSSRQTTTDPN